MTVKSEMALCFVKTSTFVLLVLVQVCHGKDPQPQQIHISATGKENISETVKKKNSDVNHLTNDEG